MRERIDSVARGDSRWVIPPALPAATVVIVRPHAEGDSPFDVVMLRRTSTMQFAAHMAVFPGGKVDPVDHAFANPFEACAVREVGEEVGIDVTDLIMWDHWVTPEIEPMRYDVHFYLAVVPPETSGELLTTEADDMLWLTPQAAHARSLDGSLHMLRPTQVVLQELSAAPHVRALRELAVTREIYPRLPRPVLTEDSSIRWDLINGHTMAVHYQGVPEARMESTGEVLQ